MTPKLLTKSLWVVLFIVWGIIAAIRENTESARNSSWSIAYSFLSTTTMLIALYLIWGLNE